MKPKPTKPAKRDDAAQSDRFIQTARELGADESPEAFDRTMKRVAPQRPAPKKASR